MMYEGRASGHVQSTSAPLRRPDAHAPAPFFPFARDLSAYEAVLALVPDFRFVHEPIRSETKGRFVGRHDELESLAQRILFSEGGSFLVTGYRGVGKTSFVNRVVDRLEEVLPWSERLLGSTRILTVQLTIARPLESAELMHHVVRRLYERLEEIGVAAHLTPKLRTDLLLAYNRTSINMTRTLAASRERNYGLNEASLGLKSWPLPWLAAPSVKVSFLSKRAYSQTDESAYLSYDDRAAEHDIIRLSRELAAGYVERPGWPRRLWRIVARTPRRPTRLKLVFVFDELDKLDEFATSGQDVEKPTIDSLLSSLKNLFTTSGISFVFVAGKDLQERWLEDLGRGDSIYESVFAYDQYLPCLWDDVEALCDKWIDWSVLPGSPVMAQNTSSICPNCGASVPEDAAYCDACGAPLALTTYGVKARPDLCPSCQAPATKRQPFCERCGAYLWDATAARAIFADFKKYLHYKGRGIPRRILREYNNYVRWDTTRPILVFTREECRRIRSYATLSDALAHDRRRLFSTVPEEARGTQQDKRWLGIYYLCDWIVRQGTNEFVFDDMVSASKLLSNKIAPAEEIAPRIIRDLLDVLLDNDYVMEVRTRLDQSVIGIAQQGDVARKYKLVPRRVVELGAMRQGGEEASPAFPGESPGLRQIGPYELLDEIGRGGMGVVYRGWDQRQNRLVAIKLLNATSLAIPDITERFRREAHTMSVLQHPNIIPFYELGEDRGQLFIAMAYLDGLNLAQLLGIQSCLSVATALAITRPVADALGYMHEHRFVRNDVKPGNIFLSTEGKVYLSDFGTTESLLADPSLSGTGAFIGTPLYMAPEQIEGKPADARADIFSLGVVLYEMLTGRRPFDGSIADILQAQSEQSFSPPSRFVMIPAEIETIVLRCLEKVPEKRFQTVHDVCAALETVPQEQDSADIASLVQATIQQIRETSAYDASWTEVGIDSRTASYSPAAAAPPSIWTTPEEGAITQVLLTPTLYGPVYSPLPRLYVLTLAGAHAAQQSYTLQHEVTTIGRSSDNDVVLRDNKVSRYHARITAKDGTYYVEDLNTANGVQVNDALIAAPVPLGDRDTIRIGQSVLEYRAVPTPHAYGEATENNGAGAALPSAPLPAPPAPA